MIEMLTCAVYWIGPFLGAAIAAGYVQCFPVLKMKLTSDSDTITSQNSTATKKRMYAWIRLLMSISILIDFSRDKTPYQSTKRLQQSLNEHSSVGPLNSVLQRTSLRFVSLSYAFRTTRHLRSDGNS